MKAFNFILFIICFQVIGFSQSSKQNQTLDNVFSAKDILPILVGIDSSFRYKIVSDSITIWDSIYRGIYGATKASAWAKYDVDGNGKNDLIVQVFWNERMGQSDIIVLLDSGLGNFSLKYITYMDYDQYFKINSIDSQKLLTLISEKVDYSNRKDDRFIQVDTLTFMDGGFIEFNTYDHKHNLGRIKYSTDGGGFGPTRIIGLEIDSSGVVEQWETIFGKYGHYVKKLNNEELSAFKNVISHIDILNLKSKYYVPYTDMPTSTITFTYGTIKKVIQDYGENGTFGLRMLQDLFFKYIDSDGWKETQNKK
jgi:hypothetical protein